jgi:sucrose-6-phosphate hydrolase
MREWTREERYRYLKDPMEVKDLYDRISCSKYRQTFHNQAVTGLMNDPNGFVWFDNRWHLFYQWCPWGAVHGLKYWYHVVSKDLVTWENLGVCLMPDEGDGYDNKGAYSGSAMPIGDKLYLYYTGNNRDSNWVRHPYTCLARLGSDGWPEKYPLPLFGAHPDYTDNQRDPKLIAMPDRDEYYIILGAEKKEKEGCILVYKSENLLHGWTFAEELKVPGIDNLGNMWECPSIEHIGGHDILMFCPQHIKLPGRGESTNHNGYIIGKMDWESLTFQPEGGFHVLDFGFDSYAAACANNIEDDDKAILIAWMGLPDASYPTDEEEWAGCLTLPRELTVRGRRLIQKPLPELKKLRGEAVSIETNTFGCCRIPDASEIEIDIRPGDCEIDLFTDESGLGGMSIIYDDAKKEITVDRSGMKRRFNEAEGESRTRPLPDGLNHLRIFVDRSSVEIFVNDGDAVFTSRVFPTEDEHYMKIKAGDTFPHIWTIKPAVKDNFLI